ncbi:MAG: hypothetical protein HZB66_02595 [Candidatus Aenigmarchaeota archaeon]|nr:hypothetical protein [Candidatus Aenigmarchaeota archaeon]
MKKLISLIVLIAVVSGCVQQSQEVKYDKNNGLVITDFSTDFATIEDDEEFTVYMTVENLGGTTATDILMDLYGVSWTTPGTKTQTKMKPPDITVEPPSPGDMKQVSWTLQAPDLPEGIKHDYRLTGRITYYYTTSAAANIRVLSSSEYKRRVQKGEQLTGLLIPVTNTYAPVKIDIKEGVYPIKVDENGDPLQTSSYKIDFNNVGSGVPITNSVDGLILGTITLQGEGAAFSDCLGVNQGKVVTLSESGDGSVKLRRGQSITKPCEISISKAAWGDKPEDTITLIFDLTYDYYTEESTAITVIGKV